MGNKRKLGQDEAAPPQTAEQVVVSIGDEGKTVEPAEQVLTDSPVPEIGAEPPPKKRKKKVKQLGSSSEVAGEILEPPNEVGIVPPELPPPKKKKQLDSCVDVAGEALETSKEVGIIEEAPPELPPPKKKVNSSVDVAGEASELLKEIGIEQAASPELPLPKKKKKKKTKVEAAGKASEPSEEIGSVHVAPPELLPSNPTVGEECGAEKLSSNPMAESEAKPEDVPAEKKKKKKSRKQKHGEPCVENKAKMNDGMPKAGNVDEGVEPVKKRKKKLTEAKVDEEEGPVRKKKKKNKSSEAENIEGLLKPVQVVARKKGSEVPVTVYVGVENNAADGKFDEGREVAKLLRMHELTTETMEKETTEKQRAVTSCVNDEKKRREKKINEGILKPVQVMAVMKGSKDPVTVCVGVETSVDGRTNERQEVAKLLRMHGLTRAVGEVENEMNTENTFVNGGNNDEVVCTMPSLEERPSLIPTDMEWRKRQLVRGLLQDDGAERQKEKESNEENVGQQKESINENAAPQKIEYPQICVICRQKGHTISTCSLLDPPLQHAKRTIAKSKIQTRGGKRGGKAVKLRAEKVAARKGESIVKDGAAEKLSNSKEAKQTIANSKIQTRGGKRGGKAVKLRAEKVAARKGESIVKDGAAEKLSNSKEAKQTIAKSKIQTRGGKRGGKAVKLRAEKVAATKGDSIVKDGAAEKLSNSKEAKQTIAKLKIQTRGGKRGGKAVKLRAEKVAARKGESIVKDGAAEKSSNSKEAKQTIAKSKIQTCGGKRGGKAVKLRAEKVAARKGESVVKAGAAQKFFGTLKKKEKIRMAEDLKNHARKEHQGEKLQAGPP